MVCISLPTKSVDWQSYGISQVMGFYRYGLRQVQLYITASGKQVLTLLQSAAAIIPVPLLQDAIGVALKIIEVCEVR